jgi:hypothetical protein
MKTSLTKLKSNFFLALALSSAPIWAKPVAQVTEVKGQVFLVSPDGKTKSLKSNDHVEEKSEIMVGEDGTITLNDYYDATYHLTEGSHLKFFDKSVQLKKGKTWIQSLNARHPLALTTANGHVGFWKSEFITTFDQSTSKSQVLVVNGDVEVSNVLDKNMKHSVAAGTFTIIDPEIENGLPRTPTKVGLDSLNTALSEFKALPEKLKETGTTPVTTREIASVESEPAEATVKKDGPQAPTGEIIFISKSGKMDRLPASAETGAYNYFKKKLARKTKPQAAPIRFYGMYVAESASAPIVQQPRIPASVKPISVIATPKKVATDLNIDAEFSNSFRHEKANQPNHSKELENLIQDLKSY